MSVSITLPLGKKEGVKNLVFTILTREYPLKLIELTQFIRKRYGKMVTFQAVRKAVHELIEEGVLEREDHAYKISKDWVRDSKKTLDALYQELYHEKSLPKKVDAIGNEMSVFTFDSLNDMMKFWEDLIDDWYKNLEKGKGILNVWQGAHMWEALLHPDRERHLMGQLKKKGVESYAHFTGNSALDKNTGRFYNSIGVKSYVSSSLSSFDKEYYVGTYGDLIVQTRYPLELVKELDLFFRKSKNLENLNLKELSDIVNKKMKIQLSVIKNGAMAKQINESILAKM